jgi:hypothetical protein
MSGSLSHAKGFIAADVFGLSLAPVFQPEKVEIGEYTFLPWVRTGLAAQLAAPNPGDVRATVAASVSVDDDAGGKTDVSKTFTLRGPSDVIGIDATQIVRRYPQPNSSNAEESYLAHIEFDRPELPWLFTPFQPSGDRLAPWIALIVVEARFFRVKQGPPGLPWQLTTKLGELQPLDDSWAWAHAQISGLPDGTVSVENRLSDSYGTVNLSRLLCPRKLDPDTSYVACVVPAFDCGVRAGLGIAGGTLGPAWTRGAGDNNQDITLPLYDSWPFQITDAGDFESLAKKLQGLAAPWPIGRRIIDCSKPRGGMTDLAAGEDGRVQVFKCALTSLAPEPSPGHLDTSAWTTAKRQELLTQVNTGDQAASDITKASDLPRVSPRLYARFQRAQSRVTDINDSDWFSQLNATPSHRVAAGLGTRVVLKDREALMQAAWAQVGDIDKANQMLALAQFARYAGAAVHTASFATQPLGNLSQLTRAAQGKLRLGGAALTVAGEAARSATAPTALSGAFRRATRLRGPLMRFFGAGGATAVGTMVAAGNNFQNYQRAYKEPDGIAGFSANSISYYSPAIIGKVMNVPAAGAVKALTDAVTRYAATLTLANQMYQPVATWGVRAGNIDLGALGASNLLNLVEAAAPAAPASAPARVEALSQILTGVSTSGIAAAATRANTISSRLGITMTRVLPGAAVVAPPVAPAAPSIAVRGPLAGVSTLAPPAILMPSLRDTVTHTISVVVNRTGSTTLLEAANTFSQFAVGIGTRSLPADTALPQLAVDKGTLLAAIHPKTTVTAYMVARLGTLPSWLASDWFSDGYVQPIMQAPVFERPMYEALDAYNRDWFIPGLGQIHETDIVTVLQTNPAFVETFIVGLSDEMGRELLWRGYPTDSRGTYFKRFWSADRDELSQPIHLFSHTALGTHISPWAGGASGRLVMLVRGELIRRYPHAIMLAQQQIAKDAVTHHPTFAVPPAPGAPGSILFHVPLTPDIILTGFMLTRLDVQNADASGPPWWFIIAEHPTAPRFGLQLAELPLAATISRDQAAWSSFGPLRLGRFLPTGSAAVKVTEPTYPDQPPHPPVITDWNAAQLHGGGVARVLLRDPFRAAWSGLKLITP